MTLALSSRHAVFLLDYITLHCTVSASPKALQLARDSSFAPGNALEKTTIAATKQGEVKDM